MSDEQTMMFNLHCKDAFGRIEKQFDKSDIRYSRVEQQVNELYAEMNNGLTDAVIRIEQDLALLRQSIQKWVITLVSIFGTATLGAIGWLIARSFR